jgi:serine/threonine protein kinase
MFGRCLSADLCSEVSTQQKVSFLSCRNLFIFIGSLVISLSLLSLFFHSILFRDLKPDNIGLNFDGNLKIFDFGLAKELKKENKLGEDQYHASAKTGTQRYMAPEVYLTEVYGLPADIYSFSIILWEMMSLKIPFGKMSASGHVRGTFEKKQRPKLRSYGWPEDVKCLIKGGWSHRPVQRPKINIVHNRLAVSLQSRGWTVNDTKAEFLGDRIDLGNSSD